LRGVLLAECLEYFRRSLPGVVNISLEFAERLWPFNIRTVDIDHGIARVLPALVFIPCLRTGLVFLKPVAISVAVFVDPRCAYPPNRLATN
jgi:hypothetical protein